MYISVAGEGTYHRPNPHCLHLHIEDPLSYLTFGTTPEADNVSHSQGRKLQGIGLPELSKRAVREAETKITRRLPWILISAVGFSTSLSCTGLSHLRCALFLHRCFSVRTSGNASTTCLLVTAGHGDALGIPRVEDKDAAKH